jgi:hypothetical protein
LPQQILWNKFHIRCAYFTPNCTWSLNYSVLVYFWKYNPFAALKRLKDGFRLWIIFLFLSSRSPFHKFHLFPPFFGALLRVTGGA